MKRRPVLADQVVAPRARPHLYIVRATEPPPLELPAGTGRAADLARAALLTLSLAFGVALVLAAFGWL